MIRPKLLPGNEIITRMCESLKSLVVGKILEDILADLVGFQRQLTQEPKTSCHAMNVRQHLALNELC